LTIVSEQLMQIAELRW